MSAATPAVPAPTVIGVPAPQEDPAALMAARLEAVPGTPTYVLAKDDGVWRIAAAQNTQVLDVATLTAG
ncbi:hypothetical protein [Streptomyces sp. CH-036]|uniref:hypothetical protein n=1 Tax=Streptomyces sp. CH-036 TaxID=3406733 RepID=UPI003C7550F9